jgi:hypothetical protein
MPARLKAKARIVIESALALAPWLIAMYAFYWLNSRGIWTAETPHRGKLSVALLAAGMSGSWFVHSYLAGRRRK